MAPQRTAAALAAAAALFLLLAAAPTSALTNPDQLEIITAFRDAMLARPGQVNWTKALTSWTCPTPAANSVGGTCDPCGQEVRARPDWAATASAEAQRVGRLTAYTCMLAVVMMPGKHLAWCLAACYRPGLLPRL